MSERARLEEELAALDARREVLDGRIRHAVQRQRYSRDPLDVDQARLDERAYVTEMDRVMTRIRAVEAKLLLLRKKQVSITNGSGTLH